MSLKYKNEITILYCCGFRKTYLETKRGGENDAQNKLKRNIFIKSKKLPLVRPSETSTHLSRTSGFTKALVEFAEKKDVLFY